MNVLVGLGLGSAHVDPRASSRLGAPAWGAPGLLRDLELRLGLPSIAGEASLRIPRWIERIASLRDERAFYAPSFANDPLGTAEELLRWRDDLVAAGWDGAPVTGGGERLDALLALECQEATGTPMGTADRLLRVERALAHHPGRLYASLSLVEAAEHWPGRWRRVFARLDALGTSLTTPPLAPPSASTDSDLGLLQAHLRGARMSRPVAGDGTLLLVRGDTTMTLAELSASLLADDAAAGARAVVVRSLDAEVLDAALLRHGLPAQGCTTDSSWRPVMQILPLAIELAFAPRDPYRVLELLTLRPGPFEGALGARLARAVTRQPGIGGKEWLRQKADVAERQRVRYAERHRLDGLSADDAQRKADARVEARLRDVAAWLEGPVIETAATRSELLSVVERVRDWLAARMRVHDAVTYRAAHAQTVAFAAVLAGDPRDRFNQEETRQLVDRFARRAESCVGSIEQAGRVAHVTHPSALLASCDRLYLWSFVAGVERRLARSPWNDKEKRALVAAGVYLVEPAVVLASEAGAWRRALLAARERVVFVVPRAIKGRATVPHPFWDEIRARLALDDRSEALLTRDAREELEAPHHDGFARTAGHPPLVLPPARVAWRVEPGALRPATNGLPTTVSALDKIAACPLTWVLEHRAALRTGAVATFASGSLLYGKLAHRVVDELHAGGAFELGETDFLRQVELRFETLLPREGATLLLPGASITRLQITRQVLAAMRALHRYLVRTGFRIASVEETVTTDAAIGPLEGRLDLRLVDDRGWSAVLDLKWGAQQHRERLEKGRAVQLAVYARAVDANDPPPAGYFALLSGQVLAEDVRMKPERAVVGPPLDETWRRVDATAKAVMERLARGDVPVTGVKRALPLLEALGVAEAERGLYLEHAPDGACGYCAYGAICGRQWEALA
jgi:hypothetical protein